MQHAEISIFSAVARRLGLAPVADLWDEVLLAWALREMDPLHPEAGAVALALNDVQSRTAQLGPVVAIKAALHALADSILRAARAFWAWC